MSSAGDRRLRRSSWLPAGVRGQSETLGVVLLLTLTVIGASAVVVLGSTAVDDSRNSVAIGSAEHSMTQLDSKASLVAHGSSTTQHVALGGDGAGEVRVDPSAGWMNVSIVNESTGAVKPNGDIMNVTMGAVRYENGDTTIAYQGGGVWKQSDPAGGSVMVSPPEFHYRSTTLTLPLVTIDGDPDIQGRAQITSVGAPSAKYPNATTGRVNPLDKGVVNVTVHSTFYVGWGAYFEERTGGDVYYDHPNQTVVVQLEAPGRTAAVDNALAATAPGGTITLSGNGNNAAYTDSYNSSEGNYTASKSLDGTISTAGDVDMSGNANVTGNLRSGGSVSLDGKSSVGGTVYWTTGFSASSNADWGSDGKISGVSAPPSVDPVVREEVSIRSSTNDNAGTTAISGTELDFGGGDSVVVPPGEYYLEEIDLTDKNVTFNTTGGATTVAVENYVALDQQSNISVDGDGTVHIYVIGDVSLNKGSSVHVPGQKSHRIWFYGTDDSTFDLQSNQGNENRFTGVIYAPTDSGNSEIIVKHATVYGALVAGNLDIGTGGIVHYDESLRTSKPLQSGQRVPQLTYLHVSVNEVRVSDD